MASKKTAKSAAQAAAVATGNGGEPHQTVAGGAPSLTTQQGTPVADDQNSLRLGERGPLLMEDQHFREKIFHFDHERIPERVVHARGYGAHGYFETCDSLGDLTSADIFLAFSDEARVLLDAANIEPDDGFVAISTARTVNGFVAKCADLRFWDRKGA